MRERRAAEVHTGAAAPIPTAESLPPPRASVAMNPLLAPPIAVQEIAPPTTPALCDPRSAEEIENARAVDVELRLRNGC